jgi:nicotinate-nucleotide pyrophosphorylase (carboxylating)
VTEQHRGDGAGIADPPSPAVREAVSRALAEDVLPLGDLTASLVGAEVTGAVAVVSRQPGVIAGRQCAEETFSQVDQDLDVVWNLGDGSDVVAGAAVATISGRLRSILTAERTALNFLCHLSGVATATRRFVDAATATNPAVRILDTRKTTPGLRSLEKAAVRAGGGTNHRGNLSDAVLIKDNHLGGVSIADAVSRARALWPGRMVEVECDRRDQVTEAVAARATVIMLDNMSPDEIVECLALVRSSTADILVEVSGGVTLDTVAAYAATGVDLISVGALTHSAPILDLGFDLAPDSKRAAP